MNHQLDQTTASRPDTGSEPVFNVAFRCHYSDGISYNYTRHYCTMQLTEIQKWIEAYAFTHPACESITAKVDLDDVPGRTNSPCGSASSRMQAPPETADSAAQVPPAPCEAA